jgi:hypothetical protein
VKQINAVPNAGTCLYDAAFQAVELAAGTASGRRAVILFTDGKDETYNGGKCSFHEVQDVIDLAKTASVPVYTLGMGSKIDEKELRRIAAETGGTFLASRNSGELDRLFSRLYEQLNNQYVLRYTSSGAPGAHTLTVGVTYRSQSDQAVYAFSLPALPTTITLTAPAEGETVSGKVLVKAKLLTQGAEVSRVEFAADGVVIGKDFSEPYEFEWDASQQVAGEMLLEAVAIGKDGAELARTGFKVIVAESPSAPAEPADTETETAQSAQAEETALQKLLKSPNLPIIAGGGGLLLIVLVVAVMVAVRRRKAKPGSAEESFELKRSGGGDEVTYDGLDLSGGAVSGAELARLTVLASDDPATIGNQYSLTQFPLVLGRSAEQADIVFSNKDLPVSRRHARLELAGRQIMLYDMGSKYGTFVNDQPVGASPVALNHGDEVRLGSRVRLRFEFIQPPKAGEDETFDGLGSSAPNDTLTDYETRAVG